MTTLAKYPSLHCLSGELPAHHTLLGGSRNVESWDRATMAPWLRACAKVPEVARAAASHVSSALLVEFDLSATVSTKKQRSKEANTEQLR